MPPGFSTETLESATFDIGRDLAGLSAGASPRVFDRRWWSNTLLQWSMKDEAFKVQLFRFIDALPALRDDARLTELAEEYFGRTPGATAAMQWGLRALSATKLGARLSGGSIRRQILQMARIFIAGETPAAAVPALTDLWKDHRAASVDLLGEATVSEVEADRYRDHCLATLRLLGDAAAGWPAAAVLERDHFGPLPRANLSIKLTALYSQLDPIDPDSSYHGLAARLRAILDLAAALPAGITFDMEQAEFKDLTLAIFMRILSEEAYRRFPYASIALQAYLTSTADDLERVLQWARRRATPIGIRLVKGAYWDSEAIRYRQRGWTVPVFTDKAHTDASYERLTLQLVEHADLIRPMFGTHNLRSLAHAQAAARLAGLPPEACEYQMIYGMAEPLQHAVAQAGHRVRIYTPVGELIPGMAYLVRRLLENTSNESFLRREYAEEEPLDKLLAAPARAMAKPEPNGTRPVSEFQNEPHTDFSRAEGRQAMARAIEDVRGQLGRLSRPRVCAMSDVPPALQRARAATATWRAVPADERAAMLVRAASLMRRRRYELAAWEIFETAKPWREADADLAEAIDFLEFYAGEMRRLAVPKRLGQAPGEHNELRWSPRGVTAVIAPWNFPLAIPTGMVSAALVTGNTVLFKPSERAPAMGHFLAEILQEAGVPSDVLQILPGGPEIGRALIESGAIDLAVFTGSRDVGLWILETLTRGRPGRSTVPHVIAEMGGKNAIIIDETADLDEAVAGVLASFTGYQGQKCSACSRAVVHEAVHDLFLQRLTEAVLSVTIGPPEEPATRIGPMIDARARDKVAEYIEIGKREGRLVVARAVDRPGPYIGPAVFAEIEPHHRLAQEEIFGPVLAVLRARDFDHALSIANQSLYALTGGVYSRSPANIARATARFDVGNLYINRPITGALVGRQPFGGHRLSGVGTKAGGHDYLQQFMVARVISENTLRRGFAPPTETE